MTWIEDVPGVPRGVFPPIPLSLSLVPGMDRPALEAGWWWTSLLHASALESFYRGAAHARLLEALQRLVEQAHAGLVHHCLVHEARAARQLGTAEGTKASVRGQLGQEIGWWAAGARASFAAAAVIGVPPVPPEDLEAAEAAFRLCRGFRAGLMIVAGEPLALAVLDRLVGTGAPGFLDEVAAEQAAYEAVRTPRLGLV